MAPFLNSRKKTSLSPFYYCFTVISHRMRYPDKYYANLYRWWTATHPVVKLPWRRTHCCWRTLHVCYVAAITPLSINDLTSGRFVPVPYVERWLLSLLYYYYFQPIACIRGPSVYSFPTLISAVFGSKNQMSTRSHLHPVALVIGIFPSFICMMTTRDYIWYYHK
jgi:hypothetical protein